VLSFESLGGGAILNQPVAALGPRSGAAIGWQPTRRTRSGTCREAPAARAAIITGHLANLAYLLGRLDVTVDQLLASAVSPRATAFAPSGKVTILLLV
jgi:hypothetical protein